MWPRKQDTRALLQIRNASFIENLAASRFESETKELGMDNFSSRFVFNSWIISQHSSWGSITKVRSSIKSRGRLCVHSGMNQNQVTAKKNLKPCVTCNDSLWTENKANCLLLRDSSITISYGLIYFFTAWVIRCQSTIAYDSEPSETAQVLCLIPVFRILWRHLPLVLAGKTAWGTIHLNTVWYAKRVLDFPGDVCDSVINQRTAVMVVGGGTSTAGPWNGEPNNSDKETPRDSCEFYN
jgi:hypothetical protein